MPWRRFRILFVAFQLVWLNAIVPGHARGTVPIAGSAPAAAVIDQGGGCCGSTADASGGRRGVPAAGDPAKRCAVCQFAAYLSPPLSFSPTLTNLGRLDLLKPAQPLPVLSAARPLAYYPCGPPIA